MTIQAGQRFTDNDIYNASADGTLRVIRVVDVATPRGPDYAHCVVETGKRPGSFTWIRVDRLSETNSRGFTPITDTTNKEISS